MSFIQHLGCVSAFLALRSLHHLRCYRLVFVVQLSEVRRPFHSSSLKLGFLDARDPDHHKKEKQLIVHQGEYFDEVAKQARDKKTFEEAIGLYLKRNPVHRRGHVEFIYAALDRMKEFSVHRDIDTYKKLLGLLPEGKMIAKNAWQVEFMHYPKQQQCCIDVLDFMESNGT